MSQVSIDILFFVILFLMTVVLTYAVRCRALKYDILDIPNHRSSHSIPTPRGGGIGFVIMFYVASLVLWSRQLLALHELLALCGGIIVAAIGYLDDLRGVKTYWRALIHLLAAVWGVAWIRGVTVFDFGTFVLHLGFIGFLIAVVTTVWLINLYNFMDGIDGIAASEAVFVAIVAACVLCYFRSPLMYVCFALAVTVLGFLIWNWPPAKIFMGDIGSGFLGYILAMFIWMGNQQQILPIPFWFILSSVFLCDSTYTLIHRMWQRKKWYEAHCEHAYQRLVQGGFRHFQVTFGLLIFNIIVCLPLSLGYLKIGFWVVALLYLVIIVISISLGWFFLIRCYPMIEVKKT